MERGQCIVPIDLPNGEYAGVKKEESWSKNIRENNENMRISETECTPSGAIEVSPVQTNPNESTEYIDMRGYMNGVFDNGLVERRSRSPINTLGCNHIVSMDVGGEVESAYRNQKGKNQANSEAALDRVKKEERTSLTHGLCEHGFIRARAFSDGTGSYTIVANGRIEEVHRWLIDETEYVRLLISNTTSCYITVESEWTDVFKFSELENDKFVEGLLSCYFKPVDDRAYNLAALKDFRSRIQEMIRRTPLEVVRTKTGWFKFGNKQIYYDGANFPQKEHTLSRLRRSSFQTDIGVEEILNGICEELAIHNLGRRISFLIGYGLLTWFSDVYSINWNKSPGIMFLGKENVCRRYADACLKMYVRVNGSDIVELLDTDKRTLTEYVDVLKDDVFVLNANEFTAGTLKFAKTIIAGRSIANHSVNVPIVVLQNVPNGEIAYSDYVTIDLNGFKVSERLCFYMQELKARLLSILEAEPVADEACAYRMVSYEEAIRIVLPRIKNCLLGAGVPMTVLDKFFGSLEQGMMMYYQFCGNEQDTLVHMLKQRFEQIMSTGEITVTGDIVKGVSRDPKYSLIVKDNAVFVPSKYLEVGIFPQLGIDRGEFRRVRDALIANGLLDIYGDQKGYTRKITIGDSRVHVYKFDISLFSCLKA